jgi:hypothetical protein
VTTCHERLVINAQIYPFQEAISRKVRKPFKLSNGFQAPIGMTLSAHQYATHHDEDLYPHPEVFDGFRFVQPSTAADNDKEKADGGSVAKGAMYTTSRSYLAFGHGRHAWYVATLSHLLFYHTLTITINFCSPGRFFASMETKLVLAYLIANYEMKWPDEVYDPSVPGYTEEGYRPPDHCHLHHLTPDTRANMMLRKRALD